MQKQLLWLINYIKRVLERNEMNNQTLKTRPSLLDILSEMDSEGLIKESRPSQPRNPNDKIENTFFDIVEFYNTHQREPDRQIPNERILAIRLDAMRKEPEKYKHLIEMDEYGLLGMSDAQESKSQMLSNILDSNFAQQLFAEMQGDTSILTHNNKELVNAEGYDTETATRIPCVEFWRFDAHLKQLQEQIDSGKAILTKQNTDKINKGDVFIWNGLLCYVADRIKAERLNGLENYRLRLVFSNGTEANILMLSLATALRKDSMSSRVILKDGSDFINSFNQDFKNLVTGYIYIMKLKDPLPGFKDFQSPLKIGFTKQSVEKRIANCQKDIAFLEQQVEPVQIYECRGLNPHALEQMIHAFLHEYAITIQMRAKDGHIYRPREWFDVDIDVIEQLIPILLKDELQHYRINKINRKLVRIDNL